MNAFLWCLVVICWSMIAFCIGQLRRNDKVCAFRMDLLDRVSICAKLDIHVAVSESDIDAAIECGLWRFNVLASVPYNLMLVKFWKPLRPDAWWDDLAFMTPPNFYQVSRKNESELRPWEH